MQINYIAGTNYGSAPSWLTGSGGVLDQVASFFAKIFTNNITINVTLNWKNLGSGVVASNSLNGTSGVVSSFSAVSAALTSHSHNAIQDEAYSNMPSGVTSVYVAPGEAEILGLKAGNTVNINLSLNSIQSYIQQPGGGSSDAFGAIAHELTEVAMGRTGNPGPNLQVMDMFRFSAPGVHNLQSGSTVSNKTAYFSIDGGVTSLGIWNNAKGQEDFGDWVVKNFPVSGDPDGDPVYNDAFGVQQGGMTPISEVDIELMNVLGWSTTIVTSGVTSTVTSGKTFTDYTVMAGGIMSVLSGGSSNRTIYTDATAFNDGVLAPSSSGGLGAFGFIQSGGYETSATLYGGGYEWVEAGGVAQFTKVSAYGSILDFGYVESATVSAHGSAHIENGGSGNYNDVLSGGVLSVHSGGLGFGNRIHSGGVEIVSGQSTLETVSAGASQTIAAGGSAGLDLISAGGTEVVATGGHTTAIFVYGTQRVYGVASAGVISGIPANQYIENGGSAVSAVLSANGYQYVSSGGFASATTVSDTTRQLVLSGGVARSTVVRSGGAAYLSLGATGDGLIVSSGGTLYGPGVLIHSNSVAGTVNGVTVGDPANNDTLELLSGGVASGVTVTQGNAVLRVDAGATATDTVVSGPQPPYGAPTELVFGSAVRTTVDSGGVEILGAGGIGNGVVVSSGGVLSGPGTLINASAGVSNTVAGTVVGVTVGYINPFPDSLEILSGGVASNVTVTIYGDYLKVDAGATATGTVLVSNGSAVVFGSATNTTVGLSATEYVSSGGVSTSATVLSGGTEKLAAGTAQNVTVSAGGKVDGLGVLIGSNTAAGAVNGIRVGDPTHAGSLVMLSGGLANSVAVTTSVGSLQVNAGASATGTFLTSFGYDLVYGSATSTTAVSGGWEFIESGGLTVSTTVSSGGYQTISTGGTASATRVLSGGGEVLSAGGIAVGVTVSSGGVLTLAGAVLSSGGGRTAGVRTSTTSISGASLLSGAILDLTSTTVLSGASDTVTVSGVVSATTVSGGREVVSSGGTARGTVVLSGGTQVLWAGGVDSGVTISNGGVLTLAGAVLNGLRTAGLMTSSSSLSGAGLLSGSILDLTSATVLSGATLKVTQSGLTSATVVSGGKEVVSSGGIARGTVVSSGGTQTVSSGGVASNTAVSSGGVEIVKLGGQVLITGSRTFAGAVSGAGDLVIAGTGDLVLSGSGAAFAGQAVISGGGLELAAAGALGTGAVVFAAGSGSATLQIDAADAPAPGGTFAYVISNFSGPDDFIDLRSIAFVAGASATVVGSKLVLHEGGKTYKFNLAGSVGVSTPVSDDGHGGTLIDPQVVNFAHTVAGLPPTAAAATPTVSNGSATSSTALIATGSGAG